MVVVSSAAPLAGEAAAEAQRSPAYSPEHIIDSGHRFFGTVSRDFAMAVRSATKRWGTPNAYILGEEASGAFVGGLRYGEGLLYTQNGRPQKVYWQGPSIGFDWGGDGARTMMLVYDLRGPQSIYRRFAGVNGSAYLIGGFGITALTNGGITVVPIRSGVGARFGANIGYLKFTPKATWNPF
ncbi:MAG: DUF1134 domain-containing protein [Methylobacteriaceae bacterium]|jgi:hypothetical protein|nr:DUF1134 domain-containing protein [Methylobacteriaceae bacterium]